MCMQVSQVRQMAIQLPITANGLNFRLDKKTVIDLLLNSVFKHTWVWHILQKRRWNNAELVLVHHLRHDINQRLDKLIVFAGMTDQKWRFSQVLKWHTRYFKSVNLVNCRKIITCMRIYQSPILSNMIILWPPLSTT